MSAPMMGAPCELCTRAGGLLLWQEPGWRIVRVLDDDFPAFYRVIAEPHVAEFTELSDRQQMRCIALVAQVERLLRQHLAPTKVNLAALGNAVPHLHWHVVARFDWDSHFPQSVWGARQRDVVPPAAGRLAMPLAELDAALLAALTDAAAPG